MIFLVTAILVLAVQCAGTKELGELLNVTVEQGVAKAIKYTVDTRNHTVQMSRAVPLLVTLHLHTFNTITT